jgi:hypothetical protein
MRKRRSVSALAAGAHITTLLVMVDRVKGGGRAPPPHQARRIDYHDGMYARKWPLVRQGNFLQVII